MVETLGGARNLIKRKERAASPKQRDDIELYLRVAPGRSVFRFVVRGPQTMGAHVPPQFPESTQMSEVRLPKSACLFRPAGSIRMSLKPVSRIQPMQSRHQMMLCPGL